MDSIVEFRISTLDDARQLAGSGHLFALLDACDEPSVPPKIMELGDDRAISLYRGMPEEEFSSFAPYLVRMDVALIDWIETCLTQASWGYYISTSVPLATLRSHLRRFLIVDDPAGEEMYFRFYDPRVLKKFLPVADAMELREFFGPIDKFLLPNGKTLNSYDMTAPVRTQRVPPRTRAIGQHFVVRKEVMAAFTDAADAAFELRLIEHLHEHHADTVTGMSDGLLLPLVRSGIRRARRYGLKSESNLTAYVALMFEIAPNFDVHPRMQMILTSKQIVPDKKIDTLIERTEASTWQEVKRRSDPMAWHNSVTGTS